MASMGSVASILGLLVAIAVAFYQRNAAIKAKFRANAEKERAANLEDHLARQRWQQLRSLGEQIDTLEKDKRHTADATGAALHARLKEQYSSLLGVIATSTKSFSAAQLRHWVYTGRLSRPWQVEEALSHVEPEFSNSEIAEDEKWLRRVIDDAKVSAESSPQTLQFPLEVNEYVAAYILVAAAVEEQLLEVSRGSGQTAYSIAVLLNHLAEDCLTKSQNKYGPISLKAWGWDSDKTFKERFYHYQELDFWVVRGAAHDAQSLLNGYEEFFEDYDALVKSVIPTKSAIHHSRNKYPDIAEIADRFLESSGSRRKALES
ncbi:hypothetical protein [Marinobacter algicola]|nr:hypothetical protein [Marinobacter algicola]